MSALVRKTLLKTLAAAALLTAAAVSAPEAQAQQLPPLLGPTTATPPAPPPTAMPSLAPTPAPAVIGPSFDSVIAAPPAEAASATQTLVGTPFAVGTPGENKFSGSVTFNQDSFFGFYPILSGAYAINDKVAFTFYGTLWTNPGFTPNGTGGSGLWTEVGAGVNFSVLDGALSINPQIGVLNGALLSGARQVDPFEGLVTQVSFSHVSKHVEAQVYGAYYIATREPRTNDFFHWWATAGVRPFADSTGFAQIISTGAHFEQLYRTRFEGGASSNIYTWLGPYVQFTLPNNVFLRMSAGWDLQNGVNDTFYKLTMGYAF